MSKKQPSRRFEVLNDFVNHHVRHLPSSVVRVWYFLWSWEQGAAGEKPGKIRVSEAQVAAACGIAIGTAQRAVQQLIKMGYLSRIAGGVHRTVSVYEIGCPLPEEIEFPPARQRAPMEEKVNGPPARPRRDRCAPASLHLRAGAHHPIQGPDTTGPCVCPDGHTGPAAREAEVRA